MSMFEDFEGFPFEGEDEFESDPIGNAGSREGSSSSRERRRKYFEEELKRYHEEKRRKLLSDSGHGDDTSESEDRPTRQFLHPDILEELVDYCVENEKFDEALDFVLLLTERAPFNGDGWHRRGMLEAHHGKFDQAIASYEHALALNPPDIRG